MTSLPTVQRRILGVIAVLAVPLVVVLGVSVTASVQSETIYVADPGKSFGPIRVGMVESRYRIGPFRFGGDVPSALRGWTISCTDTYTGEDAPHRLLSADYYYVEYGLLAHISYLFPPSEATGVEIIKPGTLRDTELPAAHLVTTQCVTPEGHPVPFETRLTRPTGAKYITTQGIGIGAALRNVVSAHGAVAMIYRNSPLTEQIRAIGTVVPARVDLDRVDPATVHQLGYCGITFTFLAGRVENIAVDAYKGAPCTHP